MQICLDWALASKQTKQSQRGHQRASSRNPPMAKHGGGYRTGNSSVSINQIYDSGKTIVLRKSRKNTKTRKETPSRPEIAPHTGALTRAHQGAILQPPVAPFCTPILVPFCVRITISFRDCRDNMDRHHPTIKRHSEHDSRATLLRSERVPASHRRRQRHRLEEAQEDGRYINMPPAEWPPGFGADLERRDVARSRSAPSNLPLIEESLT